MELIEGSRSGSGAGRTQQTRKSIQSSQGLCDHLDFVRKPDPFSRQQDQLCNVSAVRRISTVRITVEHCSLVAGLVGMPRLGPRSCLPIARLTATMWIWASRQAKLLSCQPRIVNRSLTFLSSLVGCLNTLLRVPAAAMVRKRIRHCLAGVASSWPVTLSCLAHVAYDVFSLLVFFSSSGLSTLAFSAQQHSFQAYISVNCVAILYSHCHSFLVID